MSTGKPNSPLDGALSGVSAIYRTRLINSYMDLKRSMLEERFDAAGMAAGKFCEICIRLLQQIVLGSGTPFGTKIGNMADECRKLITAQAPSVPESIRVLLPRALVFVYSVRSKRGIGHVGGDVDANRIDVATIGRVIDWMVCELIRAYHNLSLEEAQDIVDTISLRQLPIVWEVNGKKRVLAGGMTAKAQTLLLLYSDPSSVVLVEDLCDWVEYSSLALFKRDVLRPLHKKRLVEFDENLNSVHLSPSGASEVERNILPSAG